MNDNHYAKGTPGGKGGQFAPKNAQNTSQGTDLDTNSLSYVPKTTASGSNRVFFKDLPLETQEKWEKKYEAEHADVISVLDYLYDNYRTSKINTPERKFQREQWLNDEFNEQLQEGPKKQDRIATLIIGLPGSGKSTLTNSLKNEEEAFVVDADNFKNRIPEFQQDKKMVSAVHHESTMLANDFMNRLGEAGYNMVISKVGGDFKSVEYILNNLSNKGYKINAILNDVPLEVAVDRTIGRFDRGETDRLVPFYTLKVADKNVFDTFDQIMKHPSITNGKIYSNDVPQGEQPQLLHEINKNK